MKLRQIAAVSGVLLIISGVTVASLCLRVEEMASTSMEPSIRGRGALPQHEGDYVLYSRYFRPGTLASGDLVLFSYTTNGMTIKTVRRVKHIPGDEAIGLLPVRLPPQKYWLVADSTNGIDSRDLGAIDQSAIKGRVLHVFRSN